MRANSKLFWAFAGGLLIASCLLKGWLVNQNLLVSVSDIALARIALDPQLDAESRPRILIAGGSNALGGFDSTLISESTGIPTFNVGLLNEGYNYRNTFQVIENRVRSGDIVFLSTIRLSIAATLDTAANLVPDVIGTDHWVVPQFSNALSLSTGMELPLIASLFADQTLIRMLVTRWRHHGADLNLIGPPQVEGMHPRLPLKVSAQKNTSGYTFDQRGDWINCTMPRNPRPVPYDPAMVEQSKQYLAALDQFASRLQAKGVALRVAPATILVQSGDMQLWREQYLAVANDLHTAVLVPIDPSRQLLTDPSRFCDANVHLLRSQIDANNKAVIEAVENLTDNQAIIEPVKHINADGAV